MVAPWIAVESDPTCLRLRSTNKSFVLPVYRWVTQERSKTAPRLWQGWVKHWTSTHLLASSYLPVCFYHICLLLFVSVFCQYAHLPVCFGVKHHGRQQLRVSWEDCVAASPQVFVVAKIHRSSCHLQRQPFPCRLAGGLPPYASVYPTWVDCWRHLSREVSKRHLRYSVVHSDSRMQRYYHFSVIPSMFTLCLNVYFCLLLVSGQHEQR